MKIIRSQTDGTTDSATHLQHDRHRDCELHVQDALKAGFVLAALVTSCIAQSAVGPASNGSVVSSTITPELGARGPSAVNVSGTTSTQAAGSSGETTGQDLSTAGVRADVAGASPGPETLLCLGTSVVMPSCSLAFPASLALPRLHLCQSIARDPVFHHQTTVCSGVEILDCTASSSHGLMDASQPLQPVTWVDLVLLARDLNVSALCYRRAPVFICIQTVCDATHAGLHLRVRPRVHS